MTPGPSRWTPENIRKAQAILETCDRMDVALELISQELRFPVTRQAIDSAFRDAGLPTPFQHLRRRPSAIPPIEQRDTERMPVAPAVELPDDSGTTAASAASPAPAPEPSPSATELQAHRLRLRVSDLEARNKRLLEELAAKEDELSAFKILDRPPRPIESWSMPSDKQRKAVPVLLCSDWHVGEEVDPAKVNGLNEYNTEIAARCIDRLAEGFAWMLHDPRFDCRAAVIALLGDLMTGYLHPELVESNTLSPQEEQLFLVDKLEAFLRKILATCPTLERVIVPCCSGNHGRATDKQRVSTREQNSHEQVVYQTLARLFRDEPRVEFHIAAGEWVELDVFGFTMAFTHGDSFRYGGGVGGISIPIRRGIARQFQGRKIHQFCMGHFHTRQDYGDIQINGSMIGYSCYSMHVHAPYEDRQQSFFLVDSERGKCISAPIWL